MLASPASNQLIYHEAICTQVITDCKKLTLKKEKKLCIHRSQLGVVPAILIIQGKHKTSSQEYYMLPQFQS